jgi:hypothetical protein
MVSMDLAVRNRHQSSIVDMNRQNMDRKDLLWKALQKLRKALWWAHSFYEKSITNTQVVYTENIQISLFYGPPDHHLQIVPVYQPYTSQQRRVEEVVVMVRVVVVVVEVQQQHHHPSKKQRKLQFLMHLCIGIATIDYLIWMMPFI